MTGSASASTVSVPETLALLDGTFAGLAEGVADGDYAFWLGSGISLSRVEGLRDVVLRVMEFLRVRIAPDDPDCRFRRALWEVIDLAGASAGDHSAIDLGTPVAAWPSAATMIEDLISKYSTVLDVRVRGEAADYLLWDAVDVVATYASGTTEPDVEHLCIALLAAEGVAPDVATANWDGLLERAVEDLGLGPDDLVKICIANADFQATDRRSRLLKFHGCAVRAAGQPDPFRTMLIARQSQVTLWPVSQAFANMHAELISLAANKRTLMIGLSAQDSDIQAVFASARSRTTWSWDDPRPPHAFAEEELGPLQMNILKVVYGDEFDEHGEEIYERSRVRAYAKSLLIALVLDVLSRKLRAYAAAVETQLSTGDLAALGIGVVAFRDEVAAACGIDRLPFVRNLLTVATKIRSVFDSGVVLTPPPWRYRPIGALPTHQILGDPALASGGVRELAAAIGLLGRGHAAGSWCVAIPDVGSTDGALEVTSSRLGHTRLYLCANGESGARLIESGVVDVSSNDVVIVYSRDDPSARPRRSPRSAPGRTGRSGLREIGMARILRESLTIDELDDRFAKAAVL